MFCLTAYGEPSGASETFRKLGLNPNTRNKKLEIDQTTHSGKTHQEVKVAVLR